jgi:hypothetical protein
MIKQVSHLDVQIRKSNKNNGNLTPTVKSPLKSFISNSKTPTNASSNLSNNKYFKGYDNIFSKNKPNIRKDIQDFSPSNIYHYYFLFS